MLPFSRSTPVLSRSSSIWDLANVSRAVAVQRIPGYGFRRSVQTLGGVGSMYVYNIYIYITLYTCYIRLLYRYIEDGLRF